MKGRDRRMATMGVVSFGMDGALWFAKCEEAVNCGSALTQVMSACANRSALSSYVLLTLLLVYLFSMCVQSACAQVCSVRL